MKHAVIIMAHKESENLISLIKYFEKECDVFVHFDKKSDVTNTFIETIESVPHVKKVFRKYSVSWGGFSMLKCEMYMLKQAMIMSDAGYFHLFSGQDYPIKPLEEFLRFFDEHYGLCFLSYVHLPNTKWQQNTFDRLIYFFPTDIIHSRQRLASIMAKCKMWQKKLHIRRSIPQHFDHIYGGSQWFSLSRIGAAALLKYTNQHKWFYWRFMFTFAPEEVYVHSVLVNILPKNLIFPYNYRFIRWKNENGNIPSNLGKEHFHLLAESVDLFARKFEQPYSETIIPLINKYLLGDPPCHITERGVWIYDGYKKYHYEERFADALTQYFHWINATDIVDAGCGAGFLVAALRRRKTKATGFDANPYTPQLSALLLPQNDTLCYKADLTKGIHVESPFDVVLCLDVLPFILESEHERAIQTLMSLTSFALIVSLESCKTIEKRNDIIRAIELDGTFKQNLMATAFLKSHTSYYNQLYIFEKL